MKHRLLWSIKHPIQAVIVAGLWIALAIAEHSALLATADINWSALDEKDL